MKNPNIAIMLRYYRKLHNYSVKDVSRMLKEHDIVAAEKTVYAWENATTQPSADTLMLLCEMYEVPNILETFGYVQPEEEVISALSPEEKNLITEYRNQPEMKKAVLQLLGIESKVEKKNKEKK